MISKKERAAAVRGAMTRMEVTESECIALLRESAKHAAARSRDPRPLQFSFGGGSTRLVVRGAQDAWAVRLVETLRGETQSDGPDIQPLMET